MNRTLFFIGLFYLSIQIVFSDNIDSIDSIDCHKWIEMPVKTYPDYPIQICDIDSICFYKQKNTYSLYDSSAPIVKKKRTIKVKSKTKTYIFKDSDNEGEQEYFVEGSYNNWIIIKAYLYYNYEQFYMINVKSGEIDSLAGEPLFYDNKILCIEGDNTDGTKMIEVWHFMDEKISLLYSADLKRRRIYSIDDFYLRDDTVFLKTGERYLKLYYRGPWGDSSANQGFQPFKYNGKELDRVHGLDWYDYGARSYEYDDYGNQTRRSATINSQYVQDFSYGISSQFLSPTLREDNIHQTSETFGYDNLGRLNSIGNQNIYYDLKGNITSWDGVGTFNYGTTSKPYTLTGITNPGSLIQQTAQDITYTSFSRPDSIMGNGYSARFVYDEDGNRVKMTLSHNGNVVSTHYYLNGNYEMIVDSIEQTTENLYYFGDYYHATAVYQRQRISNLTTNWTYNILRDNLGSITHIIREDGQLIQELSYDAWGRLRDPQTLTVYAPGQEPVLFLGRGYTGHEHLKEFGLINMNARLYDPAIGRFLSPDPYVQMPENSQNFNRYSYCLNNPLKYTDKNGKFFVIDDFIIGFFRGAFTGENVWKTGYRQAANAFKIWEGLFTLDSNKNFWGKTWELISRFTYQSFQTKIGFLYALTNNTIGNVSQVRHLYGATVTTQSSNWLLKDGQAVTLGNFITGGDDLKADPYNSLFQHEYGHYIQSQRYGYAYMTGIGLPSLMDVKQDVNNHRFFDIERDANYRAYRYFCKNVEGFGPDNWDFTNHPLLPKGYNDAIFYNNPNYMGFVREFISISPKWYHYPIGFVMGEIPFPIF